MDTERQDLGAKFRRRNPSQPDTSDEIRALFACSCFSTLVLMALTEQVTQLPAALAAFASAWCILRL